MATQHVLITGTTSGIGRALMEHYVKAGARVTAVNRRRDAAMEAAHPAVRFECVDVRDGKGIQGLISKLVQAGELPDLFVLNAGINRVDNDAVLDVDVYREAWETNLMGAMNFAGPLTALKSWPHRITVIAVSSSTNYAANPYCLGYYVGKKSLTESFKILSNMYKGTNLDFRWVVLGPVPTGINTSSDKFPKIVIMIRDMFSVSVDRVVRSVAVFAQSGKRCLILPKRAYVLFQGIHLMQTLVPGFYSGRKTMDGQARGQG